MFIRDKLTGAAVQIGNNTRNNQAKPTDLIEQALRDNINVNNPNNQRGAHMVVPVGDNSFLVGMQYNNQAQEVFRVTINEDGAAPSVKMNWLRRFENDAVHNRPQVAYSAGAEEGYMTAVECNAQPANIGITVTKFNVATGQAILKKRIVRADPGKNKYVAEPSIADMGDTIAIGYALSAKVRDRNGNNGHAGGANVSQLVLVNKADLTIKGDIMPTPANYQRHAHIFASHYGPANEPAVAVISGSSTGTGKGLVQMIPLKADGTLGVKDPLKMYTVSTYSDVANLQARGKRNPNNQAKGFINGLGDMPNPGFDKAGGFYPEAKTFSLSTVTGYSSTAAKDIGRRESLWLSLVPSTWKEGLKTTPGQPSETAGNGPAPRTADPATDPAGSAGGDGEENVLDGTEATKPGDVGAGTNARGPQFGNEAEQGCNVSHSSSSSTPFGALGLALAGVLALVRRTKKSEEN
jgi:MYXO-CTERM domain-containing protein